MVGLNTKGDDPGTMQRFAEISHAQVREENNDNSLLESNDDFQKLILSPYDKYILSSYDFVFTNNMNNHQLIDSSIHYNNNKGEKSKEIISCWDMQPRPQGDKRCGIIFIELNVFNSADNSSFLVVRGRSHQIWSFAKGRMDSETETEEECAIREVYQETGITIPTVQGLPRIMIGRNVYFIYHTTRKQFSDFCINDTYEVDKVEWKTGRELRELSANKDIRAVLRYPKRSFPYHRILFFPTRNGVSSSRYKTSPKFIENYRTLRV